MTLTQRRQALYDWLKTEVRRVTNNNSFKVIMDEQAEQRPKPPYASLKVINPSLRIGGVDEQASSGSNLQMRMLRRFVISVQVFGPNATDILSSVRDTLDRPDVDGQFKAIGMAHESESEVRDLSLRLETTYEERAQMDIVLTYAKTENYDLSTIETVELEGTVDTGSNEIDMNFDVSDE